MTQPPTPSELPPLRGFRLVGSSLGQRRRRLLLHCRRADGRFAAAARRVRALGTPPRRARMLRLPPSGGRRLERVPAGPLTPQRPVAQSAD